MQYTHSRYVQPVGQLPATYAERHAPALAEHKLQEARIAGKLNTTGEVRRGPDWRTAQIFFRHRNSSSAKAPYVLCGAAVSPDQETGRARARTEKEARV